MVIHFEEFIKKAGLSPKFMLSFKMEGRNVNVLFENKLWDEFSIIGIGMCPLHIVNSAFGKAVKFLVLVVKMVFLLQKGMLVSKATFRIKTFLLRFHLLSFLHRILKNLLKPSKLCQTSIYFFQSVCSCCKVILESCQDRSLQEKKRWSNVCTEIG